MVKQKLSIAICSFLGNIPIMNTKRQNNFKHKNYVYIIEKETKCKWGLEWDCGCSYDIGEVSMKERETYKKHPKDYRLVMYISEHPQE